MPVDMVNGQTVHICAHSPNGDEKQAGHIQLLTHTTNYDNKPCCDYVILFVAQLHIEKRLTSSYCGGSTRPLNSRQTTPTVTLGMVRRCWERGERSSDSSPGRAATQECTTHTW